MHQDHDSSDLQTSEACIASKTLHLQFRVLPLKEDRKLQDPGTTVSQSHCSEISYRDASDSPTVSFQSQSTDSVQVFLFGDKFNVCE
jgi:hypothetical protein